MATLHAEFIKYNKEIKLTTKRKEGLLKSRKELRRKIKSWFSDNKPDELQPKFHSQGSFQMNTAVNPIPVEDDEGNKLNRYDLDDGIYFIEKKDEDNRRAITTWHNWVCEAVEGHTSLSPIDKNTCVRTPFKDGHHIDKPIYYKNDIIELAHKSKDWVESDPKKFYEWFNDEKSAQSERLVRYFKAWKDYRELSNTNLKLPSGFEFSILVIEYFQKDDLDDTSLCETVQKMFDELSKEDGFNCIRPTTPKGEDVFADYSQTRKSNFLTTLESLLKDLKRAKEESNFKKASEILRNNQFGDRFPLGEDKDEKQKSNLLRKSIFSAPVATKPYGY